MTTTLRYVGPFAAVEVEIGKTWVEVAQGDTVDVPAELVDGLLAQDVWEKTTAKKATAKKAPAKKAPAKSATAKAAEAVTTEPDPG